MRDGEPTGDEKPEKPTDGASPAPEGFPLSDDLLEEGVEGTVAPAADLSVVIELRRLMEKLTAVLVEGNLPPLRR